MAMRGRKPKLKGAKDLAGNPGKRSTEETVDPIEAAGQGIEPPMPPHVLADERARQEWERIIPMLRDMGVLAAEDMATLAAYCLLYSRWVHAEELIRTGGLTVIAKNGAPCRNPAVAVAQDSMKMMTSYIQEFGLSPLSRTRIGKARGGGSGAGKNSGWETKPLAFPRGVTTV